MLERRRYIGPRSGFLAAALLGGMASQVSGAEDAETEPYSGQD